MSNEQIPEEPGTIDQIIEGLVSPYLNKVLEAVSDPTKWSKEDRDRMMSELEEQYIKASNVGVEYLKRLMEVTDEEGRTIFHLSFARQTLVNVHSFIYELEDNYSNLIAYLMLEENMSFEEAKKTVDGTHPFDNKWLLERKSELMKKIGELTKKIQLLSKKCVESLSTRGKVEEVE
jgi:hypothetical protein